MKKQVKIIMIIAVFLIASLGTISNAASADAVLNANKTEVKKGDTFEVAVKVSCENTMDGIDSIVKYDSSKLEFVNAQEVTDATQLSDFKQNDDGSQGDYVLAALLGGKKEATVATLKFKVLSGVSVGETLSVQLSNIVITDEDETDYDVGTKTATVKVVEGTQDPGGNTNTNTNTNTNPGTNTNTNTNTNTKQNTNTATNKDNTATTKIIPYTGLGNYIFPAIVLTLIAGASYIAYKKNNI